MIDLTPIFQAIIMLLAAIVTYRLIPWIKSKTNGQQQANLAAAAKIAVYAAEQLFGSGNGEEKLDYARSVLQAAGYDFAPEVIRAALEDAVRAMNIWGESATNPPKTPEEHPPEQTEEN